MRKNILKILKQIRSIFTNMSDPNHIHSVNQPTIVEAKNVDVSTNTNAPVPSPVVIVDRPVLEIDNEIKIAIYSRARVVKWLAIIDMIFLTVNLIISIINKNLLYISFILFPLCYLGYNGAKKYKKNHLTGYVIYLGIMTLYYLIMIFYQNSFWWLFFFFIESYILYYTSRLYNLISYAPPSVVDSLQEGWDPSTLVYYYY